MPEMILTVSFGGNDGGGTNQSVGERALPFEPEAKQVTLYFNSTDHEFLHNYTVAIPDGRKVPFDLVIRKRENPSEIITVIYINDSFDVERIARFFRNSVNAGAQRYIVVSKLQLYENQLNFCRDLNVEIVSSIIMTHSGENRPVSHFSLRSSDTSDGVSHSTRKKRDRTAIIKEILQLAKHYENLGITKIIYKCNLNYLSAKNLLDEMIDRELLEIVSSETSNKAYRITGVGQSTLKKLVSLWEPSGGD